MADGWLREIRALHPDVSIGVASAGIEAGTGVKEGAAKVMAESGVPIDNFSSDAMVDFEPSDFDHVISCCGCGTKLDDEKSVWKEQAVFEVRKSR
jgi:protein-tyrosine-phosphatase